MREIDRQIEQFLTHCSMKQLSKKTLKAYNQTLYLLANYLEQVHSITSAEQVKAFHISATLAICRSVVSILWRVAAIHTAELS